MRKCNECGKKHLTDGYVIFGGAEYYCSPKCLYKNYPQERYMELYECDEAYWTTWEEDEDEE